MKAILKENRIIFTDIGKEKIKVVIPSKRFPLTGIYHIFNIGNTVPVRDETILSCIDTVEYKIGCCFTNSANVITKLQETGFTNVIQYCGWLFLGDDYPVYHSWVLLASKYLIDLAADFSSEDAMRYAGMTEIEARKQMKLDLIERQRLPNSQRCKLGRPDSTYLYVGAPCSADIGAATLRRLMAEYPDHPSFIKTNRNGTTPLQAEILKNL